MGDMIFLRCHIRRDAPTSRYSALSFDHLVGSHEQSLRHVEAECLGSLEVDGKNKFARLLDRQVGWLAAFENSPDIIDTQLAIEVYVGGVAHQAARNDVRENRIHRRNFVLRRQLQDFVAIAQIEEKRKNTDDERAGTAFDNAREGCVEILLAATFEDNELPPECTRRRIHVVRLLLERRKP